MQYTRMPIEIESPESLGYDSIACNLAESSVRDVQFKDIGIHLDDLVIAYGDHIGKPALRELIAAQYAGINSTDILLSVGAAGALFIIQSSLLQNNDHIIVVRPNYATNIETPRAIGCQISFVDLFFEENFQLDLGKLKACIQPNTKIISITTPHNPTGTLVNEATLLALCRLAEECNFILLADETYRDLAFETPTPLVATLSKHAISVSSVSKAYGIPGIRLGWIITQNKALLELFLAGKEQIHICNSIVDEEICHQYLLKQQQYFPAIQLEVKNNFEVLKQWIHKHPQLEWVVPKGGVVCFPRFKNRIAIDIEKFYTVLLQQYKTYLGPGHWFEQSKRYFRLGFGWEKTEAFAAGLHNIDKAINDCLLNNG